MTGSGKTGLIAHDSRFDCSPRTQSYMKILLSNSAINLSGLLLLAAFPKHSGDLYKQPGILMELWPAWRWMYVAVQLRGVE